MKNKILYFVLLTLGNIPLWGQVYISIDSIIFDNVIEAKDKDMYISHWGEGPYVNMNVSVTNSSHNEIIFQKHSDYQIYCTYEYEGLLHKTLDIYLSFAENYPLVIPPDSIYNAVLPASLFLPYKTIEFTNTIVYDHSIVLNEVISSLKIVLIIDGEKYESNNNPSVSIGNSFFYEEKWEGD